MIYKTPFASCHRVLNINTDDSNFVDQILDFLTWCFYLFIIKQSTPVELLPGDDLVSTEKCLKREKNT